MPHDVDLIILLAVGFGVALFFGYIAARLRLPPLIGYLIAGIIISPNTPGVEADIHLANQLAELGVMFLMFGVGMHFSLNDLLLVRRIALPGAILQIAVATLLGIGVSMLWGWSFGSALVFWLKPVMCEYSCIIKSFRRPWPSRFCKRQNCCGLAVS
ncbi:transporter, CPA2 domain protein [Acinetobacter baumannii UH9707]|nr:transporter, CPA2 domain protein [Acinetobacter baumannii UH9707]ETR54650.1 transporter, CPA2 domain protein [Acinetobacter baumannii UH9007]